MEHSDIEYEENESDIEAPWTRDLRILVTPYFLHFLLSHEVIDVNRIEDRDYVRTAVRGYLKKRLESPETIDDWDVIQVIDDDFTLSARDAVRAGRKFVALVLIATAIEHKINMFYRDVLEVKCGLRRDEVTKAIRIDSEAKLGWLLALVSGHELSADLKKRIKQVQEWRNALIHYKAVPKTIDAESHTIDRISREVEAVGIDNILSLPTELDEALQVIQLDIIPLMKEAYNIAEWIYLEDEDDYSTSD